MTLHPGKSILLCQNSGSFVDGFNNDILKGGIPVISKNQPDDCLILQNTESPEENEQWNLRLHSRNGRPEIDDLLILGMVHHSN